MSSVLEDLGWDIIASDDNYHLLEKDGVLRLLCRCDWICPICSSRCGGVSGHPSDHACPYHNQWKVV